MINKRLSVIVHGPDRQLFAGADLGCRVIDIFNREAELVSRRKLPSLFTLELALPFDGPQVYGLLIEADGHRPGWHLISHEDFVRAESGGQVEHDETILRVMLVPTRAEPRDLGGAHARLVARGSPFVGAGGLDAAAFAAQTDAAAQMAFLNIEAKLRATSVDGRSLLSFVAGIERVAVDRVFLLMRSSAKALIDASPAFAGAAGHKAKPGSGLPDHPDSWKHKAYPHGNVQLSFSRDPVASATVTESCHSVDVDIDLERGVGHAFEWLRNNVFEKGHKTDQTWVYAQLFDQNILPEYTLGAVVVPRARGFRPAGKRAAARPAASPRTTRARNAPAATTRRKRARKR